MGACVAATPRFGDTNSDARPFKCIICALETFCGPFVYFNRPLYLDCVCVRACNGTHSVSKNAEKVTRKVTTTMTTKANRTKTNFSKMQMT